MAGFSPLELARAGVFARMLVDWQLTRPFYRGESRALLRRLGPGPWRTFATLVYERGRITPAESLERGIAILRSIRDEPWASYLDLRTAVLPALAGTGRRAPRGCASASRRSRADRGHARRNRSAAQPSSSSVSTWAQPGCAGRSPAR